MMRVLKLKSKEDVMEKLPEEAQMIVVVYHDKAPMREEPEEVEDTEEETGEEVEVEVEAGGESDDSLEYMPPSM